MNVTLPDYLPTILEDDEKVLWTVRQRKYMDIGRAVCLFLAFVFVCLVAVVLVCSPAGKSSESVLIAIGALLALELVCVVGYIRRGRMLERTLFVLTGKRALIIEEACRAGGLMTVLAKAVTPDLVSKLRRRRDGSADYVLATEKAGRTTREIGFMSVPSAQSPEPILEQLGVVLPQRREKRPLCCITRPVGSPVGVCCRVLLVCAMAWALSRVVENEGALLFLYGEKTMAQVVDFEQVQEKKGRRVKREVTVNYPVVAFQNSKGRVCLTMSLYGYENPPFDRGDQVEILYDPELPLRATVNDRDILITPGILLAVLLWWCWHSYQYFRTWRMLRKTDILYIDLSGDGGESSSQQTARNAAQKA